MNNGNSLIKFSVIIPLIPKHVKYLGSLLKILFDSNYPIFEIIVSGSDFNGNEKFRVEKILDNYNDSIQKVFVATQDPQNPGENRNIGWSLAKGDYLVFCDADDSYSPHRLQIISKIIDELEPDVILHDFYNYIPFSIFKRFRHRNLEFMVSENELLQSTFGTSQYELLGSTLLKSTNVQLPERYSSKHNLHQGHLVVKRSIGVRYGNRPRGEDGEFLQNVLKSRLKVLYIPLKLSNYNRPYPSRILLDLKLRSIVKGSLIKRWFIAKFSLME